MTAKQQIAAVIALALAAVALYLLWPSGVTPQEGPVPSASPPTDGAALTAANPGAVAVGAAASDVAEREVVATPGVPGRGDLVVRLLYGDDRSPAADVMVTAFRQHEIPKNSSAPSVDSKRRRTDAQGIARFPSMRAGRTGLIADRGHWLT